MTGNGCGFDPGEFAGGGTCRTLQADVAVGLDGVRERILGFLGRFADDPFRAGTPPLRFVQPPRQSELRFLGVTDGPPQQLSG